jgi:hypothetical protein
MYLTICYNDDNDRMMICSPPFFINRIEFYGVNLVGNERFGSLINLLDDGCFPLFGVRSSLTDYCGHMVRVSCLWFFCCVV